MLSIGIQFFGGRGGGGSGGARGGGRAGGSVDSKVRSSEDYVGDRSVEKQINEQLRYSLGSGEQYADVESFKVVSNPGNGQTGDVEAEYSVSMRIPVGYDYETGQTEYEYDTEYRRGTFQVKLKNK